MLNSKRTGWLHSLTLFQERPIFWMKSTTWPTKITVPIGYLESTQMFLVLWRYWKPMILFPQLRYHASIWSLFDKVLSFSWRSLEGCTVLNLIEWLLMCIKLAVFYEYCWKPIHCTSCYAGSYCCILSSRWFASRWFSFVCSIVGSV